MPWPTKISTFTRHVLLGATLEKVLVTFFKCFYKRLLHIQFDFRQITYTRLWQHEQYL